jgi:hypothetical protein
VRLSIYKDETVRSNKPFARMLLDVIRDFGHSDDAADLEVSRIKPVVKTVREGYDSEKYRQAKAFNCLPFSKSAWPLLSLIFSFALPREQKARANLGSRRIASL